MQTDMNGLVSTLGSRVKRIDYKIISLLLSQDSGVYRIVWITLTNHTIKTMMFKSIWLTEMLRRNYPHLTLKSTIIQYITFPISKYEKFKLQPTPMIIAFKFSTSYMGFKLNDYWAKGPNFISNLFCVLIRFCLDYVTMVNNISTMYNTVKLLPLDQGTL